MAKNGVESALLQKHNYFLGLLFYGSNYEITEAEINSNLF